MEDTLEICYDIIQQFKDRLIESGEEDEVYYLNEVLDEITELLE